MAWTKPDFQEITLNMEVTGYVNTDKEITQALTLNVTTEEPTHLWVTAASQV